MNWQMRLPRRYASRNDGRGWIPDCSGMTYKIKGRMDTLVYPYAMTERGIEELIN
ncbi:MAG: hypothetical protein KAH35_05170 [Candidatus Atribacteria bacterium]|nr:hypothetical protein [Candidatus Atribacteria bacterium]